MIGDGLFSRRAYDVGDHIADYNGDLITVIVEMKEVMEVI